jgi:uncharacterized membrane protein HdeD (DUF308 family)
MPVSRPIGVTIVGIIILIQGILGLILGILSLFNLWDDVHIVAAIIAVVVSIIYLAVARGLFVGSNGARIIVMIVSVLALIGGIILLFTSMVGAGIWQALIAIIVIAILSTGHAKAFFQN